MTIKLNHILRVCIFRLTPVLAFMVLLYGTVIIRFTDGPIWRRIFGLTKEYCERNWWATLYYVSNYANPYEIVSCIVEYIYLLILHRFVGLNMNKIDNHNMILQITTIFIIFIYNRNLYTSLLINTEKILIVQVYCAIIIIYKTQEFKITKLKI